jgi:CheY-like chemotaxis protein
MANKILLVDDSQELVDSYVAFLETVTAYEVRAATSGRAGLDIARSWRPDIVVTDIMMPDMNGLELITHMRSELPPPLPLIVAMSGFPDVEREARHRGAEVFQTKPVDADQLVALIESLLAKREPPAHIGAASEVRRQQASELAKTAVSAILERRPHFPDVAQLGTRLLSRYFDDADAALLLIGDGHLKVFASSGWPVGMQPDGVLGYALDVVASGSTLIVPDLAAMPNGSVRANVPEWRLLAAVPVCSMDGTAIGALMVADRRPVPFDVHDLGILEHIAARLGDVFSGAAAGVGVLEGPALLRADSWRHGFGCELSHLLRGRTMVVAMASLAMGTTIPVRSREQLAQLVRATDDVIARLPARTALGRLTPHTVAAYSLVEDSATGERAVLSLIDSLEAEPRRACIAIISATDMSPCDGGAALLEILQSLLASATARGPATALSARLAPAPIERPYAA